jgi:hypothetical protein
VRVMSVLTLLSIDAYFAHEMVVGCTKQAVSTMVFADNSIKPVDDSNYLLPASPSPATTLIVLVLVPPITTSSNEFHARHVSNKPYIIQQFVSTITGQQRWHTQNMTLQIQ